MGLGRDHELAVSGRLVILDLKLASGTLSFLNPLGVLITQPFAGSYEAGQREPWKEMERHFVDAQLQEYYLGFVYIASGMKQAHLESRKSSMANGRRET